MENGGKKLLKASGVGDGIISVKKEGGIGGWRGRLGVGGREGECRECESEKSLFNQKETRYIEVLDVWDEFLVGRNKIHYIGPPAMWKTSEATRTSETREPIHNQ